MPPSNVLSELTGSTTCGVCGYPHPRRTTCFRCGGPLGAKECRICTNCDLAVLRLQRAKEQEERERRFATRLRDSRLPKDVISGKRTLATWEIRDGGDKLAIATVKDWASMESRNRHPFLFITGPPGCGKSHLAAAALREWIKNNERGGMFILAFDLMTELRSADNEAAMLSALKFAPALVIDDIGTENLSEYTTNVWSSLLTHRGPDQESMPTIITSNLTLDQLAGRWTRKQEADLPEEIPSQRVTRRIADYGTWLELNKVYKHG